MTAQRLKDRIALITGASRGLGRAVALAFAKEGAHVLLLARGLTNLGRVDDDIRAAGGQASLIPLDLADGPAIDALGPNGDGTLNGRQANGLLSKVHQAEKLIGKNKLGEAIAVLEGFLQQVEDLEADAVLDGEQADDLTVCAEEIIEELEPVDRGLYGGTIGYFGAQGDMDQAITIRTMVFRGDTYSFQAGAGVVADSVPQTEYQEVLAKSAIVRRALALAEEGL